MLKEYCSFFNSLFIAITFQATGAEIAYRSSLLSALKLLQKRHSGKYKIMNVSERRYDLLQLNEPGGVSVHPTLAFYIQNNNNNNDNNSNDDNNNKVKK